MKFLLGLLMGAGAGVVGTYLYFNKRMETIIDEKVNKEMKEFFEHQTQTMSAEDVEVVTEEEIEEEKVSDKPETQEKSSIVKMEEDVRTNYRSPDKETYHGNDGIEEDEEDDDEYITDEEMEELMEESRNRMAEQPRIIEEDDMLIGYEEVEYFWHPKGNIITDGFDHELEEKDFLDILFKPIDWRKELKNKNKIIIMVPEEATNYTVWNEDISNKG